MKIRGSLTGSNFQSICAHFVQNMKDHSSISVENVIRVYGRWQRNLNVSEIKHKRFSWWGMKDVICKSCFFELLPLSLEERGGWKRRSNGIKGTRLFPKILCECYAIDTLKKKDSVDFFVTFAGVKEVCQERLICNTEVSAGFLATPLCYRMCVIICLLPFLDGTFNWLPLSNVFNARTLLKETQVVTGLPGSLGHTYDVTVSNTAKNECSNYLLSEMFTASQTGCKRGNVNLNWGRETFKVA